MEILTIVARFSILIVIGLLIIFYYYIEKEKYERPFKKNTFIKTYGTVTEIISGLKKGKEAHGRWYKVEVSFKTHKLEYTKSISKHTVEVGQYKVGDRVEIMYCGDNPKLMYIVDNKVMKNLNKILYIGCKMSMLGLILMLVYILVYILKEQ